MLQCALLYTASCGERRIRVHTMSVQLVSDMAEMFKSIDCGALACMLGKLGVEKSYGSRLDDTRQVSFMQSRWFESLRCCKVVAMPVSLTYIH